MTDSPPPAATPVTRAQWWMLIGILFVATFLRFIYIGFNEADFDELWHLKLSAARGAQLPLNVLISNAPCETSLAQAPPWYTIPSQMADVTHPPVYCMLLRGWRAIFGDSLTAARCLAAVFSVLCVAAMFDVMRRMFNPTVAIWGSLLLALSATQIDFAQQVRAYSLLTLFTLWATSAFLSIEQIGIRRGNLAVVIIALLAAMFTHYFVAPVIVTMCLYALIRFRASARWWTIGAATFAVIIFLAIWGPMIVRQMHAVREAETPGALLEPAAGHVVLTLERLASTPLRHLFEPRPPVSLVSMLSGVLFLFPWLVLRQQPRLLLFAIWLIASCGFAAALDLFRSTRHLELIRHTALAAPAVCGILAGMMAGRRALLAHGLPAMISIACIGSLGLAYERPDIPFSNLHFMLVGARAGNEPMVFYSDLDDTWWSEWLFVAASHYSGAFPRTVVRLNRPASPELVESLRHWRGAWVIFGKSDIGPAAILPGGIVAGSDSSPFVGTASYVRWDKPTTEVGAP